MGLIVDEYSFMTQTVTLKMKDESLVTVVGPKEIVLADLIERWMGEDAVNLYKEVLQDKDNKIASLELANSEIESYIEDADYYSSALHDTLDELDGIIAKLDADSRIDITKKLVDLRRTLYEIL